ncbi:MAG: nucleotide exchange factor GrpE [Candidatus Adiutrix sp.]|jgi:molecular chaperone GrpE|nr:nucleotide exchange factor GrpE [Candidatus Adiutrix sp.]
MLGLLSEKKFYNALTEMRKALEVSMELGMAGLDERFQKNERQERRNRAALENMIDEHETMLGILRQLLEQSPPTAALLSFAESFALWRLAAPPAKEFEILADKLDALLNIFGLKLISETGVPFDPASHEACHVRFDPEQPENSVLEIIQPGFVSQGRVLRYATVVVNRHD